MDISTLLRCMRNSWKTVFAVHLLFTLASFAILTPLFTILLQLTLTLSGNTAVMDQDIALLLLSPGGLMTGILLLSILIALMGLESGALLAVAQADCHRKRLSAFEASRFALSHALTLLRLTLGLTLRVLAYLAPFVAVCALVAWATLTEHDINYYLNKRPPEFLATVAVALTLGALLAWLLGRRLLDWSLALPLALFGKTKPEQAFSVSQNLVAGKRIVCLRAFIAWLCMAVLLGVIPLLFLELAIEPALGSSGNSLATMALLISGLGAVWTVISFLVAALNLAGFSFVIARLYEALGDNTSGMEALFSSSDLQGSKKTAWSTGKLTLAATAIIALGAAYLGMMLKNIDMHSDVLVIAHRGAAGAAPENTMASIRKAIADGTDWVEIDVQETLDGHVIVVHDSDFMKLAGNPTKIWEGELHEVRQIDIGSWFDPAFSDQRVPTLEEVLQVIKASEAQLVIELKYYGHDENLEQRVIDIVEAADMADRVAVMSLKLDGVKKIRSLRPAWHTGLLAVTAVGDITRLDVDFLAVNQRKANSAFIRRAHESGKKVFVWTVNDALSLSHWMTMGVDGVITDEPALARDILAQRAKLSAVEGLMLSAALFFGKPEALKQYRDSSP